MYVAPSGLDLRGVCFFDGLRPSLVYVALSGQELGWNIVSP